VRPPRQRNTTTFFLPATTISLADEVLASGKDSTPLHAIQSADAGLENDGLGTLVGRTWEGKTEG